MAFAKISEELIRSKLDSRSAKYVLVGYCDNGYRLYDQGTCLIVILYNIIFDEGLRHCSLTTISDDDDDLVISTSPVQNYSILGVIIAR